VSGVSEWVSGVQADEGVEQNRSPINLQKDSE
jgi:hypothetical protein